MSLILILSLVLLENLLSLSFSARSNGSTCSSVFFFFPPPPPPVVALVEETTVDEEAADTDDADFRFRPGPEDSGNGDGVA